MSERKAFIETYGCAANTADSGAIASYLKENGYELSDSAEDASVVVVNTCSVKNHTESKILTRLQKIKALEKEKGFKTIVTGCLVAGNRRGLLKIASEAELVRNRDFESLGSALGLKGFNEEKSALAVSGGAGVLRVSEGCLSNCTFCSTKLARGNTKSYSIERITRQVREGVENGLKEFYISSEDTGAYGLDRGEDVAGLVKSVCSIPGNFRLRVGMMNPDTFYRFNRLSNGKAYWKELVEAMRSEKAYKFLHLPVQSGSNQVLRDMNRLYSIEQFTSLVEFLRKELLGVALSTDFIVGFPTETEEFFNETLELVKGTRFDFFNVSRYSPRPGTKAAELKQLPGLVVKERAKKLMSLAREKALEANQAMVGREVNVFVLGRAPKKGVLARTENNKQVILGAGVAGSEVTALITRAESTHLFGELVENKDLK
ncbi:MAG TPA: tRNA (N(6)-L-threonylcarbamoyladenosine(37)-C(2))-methylthiotransferase [archaeon]|nr:tRNA (N(6)-L-threonylcarbamoyladenosine(37)-C(2))-methylthiotransferase [archaeon]